MYFEITYCQLFWASLIYFTLVVLRIVKFILFHLLVQEARKRMIHLGRGIIFQSEFKRSFFIFSETINYNLSYFLSCNYLYDALFLLFFLTLLDFFLLFCLYL